MLPLLRFFTGCHRLSALHISWLPKISRTQSTSHPPTSQEHDSNEDSEPENLLERWDEVMHTDTGSDSDLDVLLVVPIFTHIIIAVAEVFHHYDKAINSSERHVQKFWVD